MANWKIMNVALRGVASCVPKEIVRTEDMTVFGDAEAIQHFIDVVGIKERRVAPENVTASDLSFKATETLLAELDWERDSIDALVFVSTTHDYRSPSTSAVLHGRLGLKYECFTLDIAMACCGYLHGLTVLSNLMSSGNIRRGLLLVGDTQYRCSSPYDQSRLPIFGDCGTASAFEFDERADEIISYSDTDGKGYKAIIHPSSGFRNPVTPASFEYEVCDDGIKRTSFQGRMNGLDVFSFAISKTPKLCKELLIGGSISTDAVDYWLLHQANRMINEKIKKKLKLSDEQTPHNIEQFANCSCATIPLLMTTEIAQDLRTRPLNLVMVAFGVGLTWGCVNIHTNNVVCPPLIEY